MEVILLCTHHPQTVAIAGAAGGRHGDALAAGEVVACDTAFGLADILNTASGYDLAAVHSSAGPHVHKIICTAHGILIVFYHDHRIAQIPQIFQGSNELIVIPLVQTDRGFIQHIQHAGQGAADLGRQADTLALTAGKGARCPGQCKVIQADALQKLQAVLDLFQDLTADLGLVSPKGWALPWQ